MIILNTVMVAFWATYWNEASGWGKAGIIAYTAFIAIANFGATV